MCNTIHYLLRQNIRHKIRTRVYIISATGRKFMYSLVTTQKRGENIQFYTFIVRMTIFNQHIGNKINYLSSIFLPFLLFFYFTGYDNLSFLPSSLGIFFSVNLFFFFRLISSDYFFFFNSR